MVVVIVVAILVVDEGVPVKKFSFWNNTNAKCMPSQKYFWMETIFDLPGKAQLGSQTP